MPNCFGIGKNANISRADPRAAIRACENHRRLLSVSLVCCTFLFSGCAISPEDTVQTHVFQTLWSSPVQVTHITLPGQYTNVQSAAGYVWATQAGLFSPKTIKIEQKSNEITELPRPGSEVPDFLVDENSIWYTDGTTLSKVDIETNLVTTTIQGAGIPFALGDGSVWTYNRNTQIVSGIDAITNQIRTQLPTHGRPYHPGSFAYGAGSIWQFAYIGNVTMWQDLNIYAPALASVVRRIDPNTNKVIAEIPVGLFTNIVDAGASTDRIHFVAGAIWILGRSAEETFSSPSHKVPFVKRIDVETNRVTATILLDTTFIAATEKNNWCGSYRKPQTPVFLDGGLWISVYCGRAQSELLKINIRTNQIAGAFTLYAPGIFEPVGMFRGTGFLLTHPELTVTGDSLWGFDGHNAIRVDF
jgi:hypothetical protein